MCDEAVGDLDMEEQARLWEQHQRRQQECKEGRMDANEGQAYGCQSFDVAGLNRPASGELPREGSAMGTLSGPGSGVAGAAILPSDPLSNPLWGADWSPDIDAALSQHEGLDELRIYFNSEMYDDAEVGTGTGTPREGRDGYGYGYTEGGARYGYTKGGARHGPPPGSREEAGCQLGDSLGHNNFMGRVPIWGFSMPSYPHIHGPPVPL